MNFYLAIFDQQSWWKSVDFLNLICYAILCKKFKHIIFLKIQKYSGQFTPYFNWRPIYTTFMEVLKGSG